MHTLLQGKQGPLSPWLGQSQKGFPYKRGGSLCSTGWRCLKKPSLCPTNCTALVQDDPATLSTWPYHPLHPLSHEHCWKNAFLSVKRAYVTKGQEMVTTEKMKRDFTDSTTKFQLFRRSHTNYKMTVTCAGWAEEEEMEKKRFIFSAQVTKKVSGRDINQLPPHYP